MLFNRYFKSVTFCLIIAAGCCNFKPVSCMQALTLHNLQASIDSFEILEKEMNLLPADSLVIFDVDETLFSLDPTPKDPKSPWLGIFDNKRIYKCDKLIDQKLKKIVPFIIEPTIVQLIDQLQKKNIKVIALTAGSHFPCPEVIIKDPKKFRIQLLHTMGIHFEKSFPEVSELEFTNLTPPDYASLGYCPIFSNGILFSAPYKKKGETLETFLKGLVKFPSMLVYFDNSLTNVKDIARTAERLNIPYQSFEYTRFNNVSAHAIKLYYQKTQYLLAFNRWLSDAEAEELVSPTDT